MAFTLQTLNAFEMTQRAAACEITANRPGYRGFVGVYPPRPDKKIEKWRVRKFLIPENLINQYFGEEQLVDSELIDVNTLAEVESLLSKWGIDSAILDAPWKSDYPL